MHILFDLRIVNKAQRAVSIYLTALVDSLVSALQPDDQIVILHRAEKLPFSPIIHPAVIYRTAMADGRTFAGERELRILLRFYNIQVYFSTDPLVRRPILIGQHRIKTIFAVEELQYFIQPTVFSGRERWAWWLRGRSQLRNADALVAPSRAIAKRLIAYLGFSVRKRTHVILNGVHPIYRQHSEQEIATVRRKYLIPQKYTLAVQNCHDLTSLETLFRSLSFNEEVSSIPCFVLGDRTLSSDTRHLIHKYHLEGLIHSLDEQLPQADLSALFSGAMVTFNPSTIPGYLPSVVQSMACGTPVICGANEVTAELFGSAAVRVHPTNADEWRKAFTALMVSAPLRDRLIQRGLACAAKQTWTMTARELLHLARGL